jgi:hypothetical protein
MTIPIEARLQPYERELRLAQEVLFFHRPLVLGVLVASFLAFAHFVSESEAGVIATVTLILCVYYGVIVVFEFFGPRLEPYLFSALPPLEPGAPNRVRSVAEIASCVKAAQGLYAKVPSIPMKGAVVPLFLVLLAVVLRNAELLVLNVVAGLALLLLPGILVLPRVYPLWRPAAEKLVKLKRD